MNDIGLDVHSATFTVAVLNDKGKVVRCRRRPTSERNLIEELCAVVAPRRLVVEESTLAQWVKTVAEPYMDQVVICDPRRNRWIAKEEFNDDRSSSIKLAELMRGGYIKEIPHPSHDAAQLRRLFYHYFDLNRQTVRFKNKLKATFRQAGRRPQGSGVYGDTARQDWLKLLEGHSGLLHQARDLYRMVDLVEQMKSRTLQATVRSARRWDRRSYDVLNTVPGIGKVIASGYMAIIVHPDRFGKENKLWRYAGLGNVRHVSDDVVYSDRPSRSGNRVLKWLVGQHFQGAVVRRIARGKGNRFTHHYQALLATGHSKKVAKRTICRNLLSVVRAVWKKGEAYRDNEPGQIATQ